MMSNWVCLDCGRGGLTITDMFTEVPMMETVDGQPVGRCKKCDLVFEPEPLMPNSRWQQFKIFIHLVRRKYTIPELLFRTDFLKQWFLLVCRLTIKKWKERRANA